MDKQNNGNRKPRSEKQMENIKKAVQTRVEQGKKTKELNDAIKRLKNEKSKSLDEEIYNIKQKIEKIRYQKKLEPEEIEVDYRQEYFKLVDKYHRLIKVIELDAIIDDILINESEDVLPKETREELAEKVEDQKDIIDVLQEKDYLPA